MIIPGFEIEKRIWDSGIPGFGIPGFGIPGLETLQIEQNKSVLPDHVINWNKATVIGRESVRTRR